MKIIEKIVEVEKPIIKIKEVIKMVPGKETIKEVIKEVPKEVIREVEVIRYVDVIKEVEKIKYVDKEVIKEVKVPVDNKIYNYSKEK